MATIASSQLLFIWAPLLFVLSMVGSAAGQQTLLQRVKARENLSLFHDALQTSGLGDLLADPSKALTLFVPTDEAMQQDYAMAYLDQPGWNIHLKAMCELHIVLGSALPTGAVFAGNYFLSTTQGPLAVSKDDQTIGGASLLEGGTAFATNGIMHAIDGVLKNEWRGIKLSDRAASSASILNQGILESGFSKELDNLMDFGTTFVAVSNDFFAREESQAVSKSMLNASMAGETYKQLLYNTINVNLYEPLLKSGINYIATPRGGEAQMWVTKDDEGTVRFNDAVATGFEMAENGVFYTVDKLLLPPGVVEFLGVSAKYSDLDVTNAYELFSASSLDTSNLARLLGTERRKLTMFAPTDAVLNSLPVGEVERLLDPIWSRHLDDLLKHWLTKRMYTRNTLRDMAVAAGGTFELSMLSGSSISVVAEDVDGLSIVDGLSNGSFLKPTNLAAVDGMIHVVDTVLLPPSFKYTVFERATNDPQLLALASFMETPEFEDLFDAVRPLTLFAPEDSAFDTYDIFLNETTDLLQSHMFEGLLFSDLLLEMGGKTITSINGHGFLVTVANGTVILSAVGSTFPSNATVVATDILGNNGVMHRISGVVTAAQLHPANDMLAESETNAPSDLNTEMPDETIAPTEVQTQVVSQIVTMAATITQTEVVSQEGTQSETIWATHVTSMDGSGTAQTIMPSDEAKTIAPSTESPSSNTRDNTEGTYINESATESPSIQSNVALGLNATSVTTEPSLEKGEGAESILTVPSMSPTQLVGILTEPDVSGQGNLYETDDSTSQGQTTASATSGAQQDQQSINVFSLVLVSGMASIISDCISALF